MDTSGCELIGVHDGGDSVTCVARATNVKTGAMRTLHNLHAVGGWNFEKVQCVSEDDSCIMMTFTYDRSEVTYTGCCDAYRKSKVGRCTRMLYMSGTGQVAVIYERVLKFGVLRSDVRKLCYTRSVNKSGCLPYKVNDLFYTKSERNLWATATNRNYLYRLDVGSERICPVVHSNTHIVKGLCEVPKLGTVFLTTDCGLLCRTRSDRDGPVYSIRGFSSYEYHERLYFDSDRQLILSLGGYGTFRRHTLMMYDIRKIVSPTRTFVIGDINAGMWPRNIVRCSHSDYLIIADDDLGSQVMRIRGMKTVEVIPHLGGRVKYGSRPCVVGGYQFDGDNPSVRVPPIPESEDDSECVEFVLSICGVTWSVVNMYGDRALYAPACILHVNQHP